MNAVECPIFPGDWWRLLFLLPLPRPWFFLSLFLPPPLFLASFWTRFFFFFDIEWSSPRAGIAFFFSTLQAVLLVVVTFSPWIDRRCFVVEVPSFLLFS